MQKILTPCVKRYEASHRTWEGGKSCIQNGFEHIAMPNLAELGCEINQTPGEHPSDLVRETHQTLFQAGWVERRSQHFIYQL
mgnify:CR=1 FL=1